jgi:hypothetical protein
VRWLTIGSNAYITVVKKPEGKRPLGRPRRRWKTIKMNMKEMGVNVWTGCICQYKDRCRDLMNTIINPQLP